MRKSILWLFALVLLAVPLHAGGIGPMFAYWDTQDASDDEGYGLRLTADLGSRWNLEMRASWFDNLAQISNGIVYKVEAFPIDVGLSYGFKTGRAGPYIGAGFTYVDLEYSPVLRDIARRLEVSPAKEEIGLFYMLGVDFPVGHHLAFFIEGIYRQVKAEVLSTDVPDFTSDLTGPGANVGVVLRF